jgi:hypothetical protein
MANRPVSIFIAYAEPDEYGSTELQKHLVMLRRKKVVSFFDQHKSIAMGADRTKAIEEGLQLADIILLILSPDFVASDECYDIQEKAIAMSAETALPVIPVLYKECDWTELEAIGRLQPLPRNKKFFGSNRQDEDRVFTAISKEIGAMAKQLQPTLQPKTQNPSTPQPKTPQPLNPSIQNPSTQNPKPPPPTPIDTSDLIDLFTRGDSKKVLELLVDRTQGNADLFAKVVQMKARWQRLENDIMNGVISHSNSQIETNRINQALLNFIMGLGK